MQTNKQTNEHKLKDAFLLHYLDWLLPVFYGFTDFSRSIDFTNSPSLRRRAIDVNI